ncbi:MAG: shikimate dehydrogenase [Candidatus Omnitrophota bacterium]
MTPSEKKIYGLIGLPLSHSLSPLMHNAAFRALKINSEYRLFELKLEGLESFFGSLPENNIYGLNVTVPYKEKILTFLDKISDEAKIIGAVNTIRITGNILEGFNTDGEGFLKNLKEDLKFEPKAKAVIILGAGGAGRAISVYLCKENPGSITIYDVDSNKAAKLVSHLKENFKGIIVNHAGSIAGMPLGEADLLVNAAPIGLKESDPCVIDLNLLGKNILVYDLIYNPKETKLLRLAKERGIRVSNGLGMLLYQGMIAFEIWTGKAAPKEVMQKALEGHA